MMHLIIASLLVVFAAVMSGVAAAASSSNDAAAASSTSTSMSPSLRLRHHSRALNDPFLSIKIKELRWVNADSNQRNFVIAGTPVVPINTNEEFADTIDAFDLPNAELSMEAIIAEGGGAVGSVKFTYNNITVIENSAPFALCANNGVDFFACTGLRQSGGKITAQAFAGKDATGPGGPVLLTYIRYATKAAAEGSLRLYNANTDQDVDSIVDGLIVNLTQTPSIAVVVDAFGARGRWTPQSVKFDYDNGARLDVETKAPFAFPGNSGADYLGITPSLGNHTIAATLYSKNNLSGQSKTWGPYTLTVVA